MTAEEGKDEPDVFMVLDATRAHFHSPAPRHIFVELCEIDAEDNMCALLDKSMYGTRDAAANWEEFSAGVARDTANFAIGKASPCLMWHASLRVRMFKHGDDFVLSGRRGKVQEARDLLKPHIELKEKGVLGSRADLGEVQQIRILN